jgi:predicted TIM-barrel fold metal-dependent hydrolase
MGSEIPRIVSVDDHVVEPPGLWVDQAPSGLVDRVPRVVRTKAYNAGWVEGDGWQVVEDASHPAATWADKWVYEDSEVFITKGFAAAGTDHGDLDRVPLNYDEHMRPGCFDKDARLEDMDRNHTDVSLCFPTVPRFCGQFFLNRRDPSLAAECIRMYNDWTIDEWCAGSAAGRLVPVVIVPLWDVALATAEIRRCAAKGAHAVAFTESPTALGFPSLYTGHWDPFIAACAETDTVINMHIGSSSTVASTSPDAPPIATTTLLFQYGMYAVIDWLLSGVLARNPDVRIAMSEAQAGWLPYILDRLDKLWARGDVANDLAHLEVPPSEYARRQIFSCLFDDLQALRNRDAIGMSQLMFETDYPHADSTWPGSADVARRLVDEVGLDEHDTWRLVRGNAIDCYRLDRYFSVPRLEPTLAGG